LGTSSGHRAARGCGSSPELRQCVVPISSLSSWPSPETRAVCEMKSKKMEEEIALVAVS